MTNYDVLEKFLDISEMTMFSKPIPCDFARIIYNETDTTQYYNFALTDRILSKNEVVCVEEKLKALNRKPAIYFENTNLFNPFVRELIGGGYVQTNEDSWMFYDGGEIDKSNFYKVKTAQSSADLAVWLETINNCYRADDPDNPYGELGAYLKIAERAWNDRPAVGSFEYFIVYKDVMPVAVAALTIVNGLAYISSVGSLRRVRGQGFGKLATLFCVQRAKDSGLTEICLATEEGTHPNEFYKRIGFTTRFTAKCYVKN